MKGKIDFEKITPLEIFYKFPNFRKIFLEKKILKIINKKTGKDFVFGVDNLEDKEIVIPSFKCIKYVKESKISYWLPFYYEVFWHLLEKVQNIEFALSELDFYKNNIYTFGNGAQVELEKNNNNF